MSPTGHCPSCGFTWEAKDLISVGPGATVKISSVSTNCPSCGKTAEILDGTWTGTGQSANLRSGPPRSVAIQSAFRSLVADARKGKLTPQQVQARAAELDEGLGKAVSTLIIRYPKTAVFIIALIAMLKFMNMETKIDVNDLVHQVIEYVDQEAASEQEKEVGASHEADGSGPTTTPTQDRLPRAQSQTRRNKNRARRRALRERRAQFKPKK